MKKVTLISLCLGLSLACAPSFATTYGNQQPGATLPPPVATSTKQTAAPINNRVNPGAGPKLPPNLGRLRQVSLAYTYRFNDMTQFAYGLFDADINWNSLDFALSYSSTARTADKKTFTGASAYSFPRNQPVANITNSTTTVRQLMYVQDALIILTDTTLSSFDAAKYTARWQFPQKQRTFKFFPYNNMLLLKYENNCNPTMYELIALNGASLRQLRNAPNFSEIAAVPGTEMIVGSSSCGDLFTGYDSKNQRTAWSSPSVGLGTAAGNNYYGSFAVNVGGQLFAKFVADIVRLDPVSGAVLSKKPISDSQGVYHARSAFVLAGNDLITAILGQAGAAFIARIDPVTMQIRWKTPIGTIRSGREVIRLAVNQNIVAVALDNALYLFSMEDGTGIFSQMNVVDARLPSTVKMSPDGRYLFTHTMEYAYLFSF